MGWNWLLWFLTGPEDIACFVTDVEIHETQTISLLILWFFCEMHDSSSKTQVFIKSGLNQRRCSPTTEPFRTQANTCKLIFDVQPALLCILVSYFKLCDSTGNAEEFPCSLDQGLSFYPWTMGVCSLHQSDHSVQQLLARRVNNK